MNIEVIIDVAFEDELQKIARKKNSAIKKVKSTFRKKKRSLFNMMSKYPVLEAIGSLALTAKGMHHLSSGGMFGKKLKSFAASPRSKNLGSLGMGVGTAFLGLKGLANVVDRL